MSKVISVQDLTCSYEKQLVLSRISFELKQHDILFVMGNNGAGKTTLLNCLLDNIPIDNGNVQYFGENMKAIEKERMAKVVAYVPQNVNINCDFKVKDYLILGRNPYISLGNPKEKDYAIVERYANITGVMDIINRPFNTLSGGQKQWVAITRALIQETPILIMDEPMSALDLGKQADYLKLISYLSTQGKTIVLTSHNPNHCFYLPECKVCLLNNRGVLEFGTVKDVFTPYNIEKIYGSNVSLNSDSSGIVFKT